MHQVLLYAILSVLVLFTGLTAVIVVGKGVREIVVALRARRRDTLEPKVLAFVHGDDERLLPALGGSLGAFDRGVVEAILLDHVQRVRGIERERIGRALDELGFVDRQLDGLRSRRWWRRADSAEKLGLAGHPRVIDDLIGAMRDEVSEVRIRAAKALGSLGGAATVAPLIEALREPSRWSTIRIADILTGIGREAVPEIQRVFPELRPAAKVAVIDVLGRIRTLDAAPWLREQLRHRLADVRARSAHALGSIGEPGSADALIETLHDPSWATRAMAAKALGRLQIRAAIEPLSEALRDREWWVRRNAAEALRSIEPGGLDALERMVDDHDRFARHQAVLMLQELGEVDRRVAALGLGGPEAEQATEWLRRIAASGQVGRLQELADSHPNVTARERLQALIDEAALATLESADGARDDADGDIAGGETRA